MEKGPNDTGALNIEGHIKIYDPTNGKVFVNKRSSNA